MSKSIVTKGITLKPISFSFAGDAQLVNVLYFEAYCLFVQP